MVRAVVALVLSAAASAAPDDPSLRGAAGQGRGWAEPTRLGGWGDECGESAPPCSPGLSCISAHCIDCNDEVGYQIRCAHWGDGLLHAAEERCELRCKNAPEPTADPATEAAPKPTAAPATKAAPEPTAASTPVPAPDASPAPTSAATPASIPAVGLNGNWNNLANAWSTDVVYASSICVRSVGGFLMSFDVWDTESNFVSTPMSLYSSPQTTCVDISEVPGVREGSPVSPRIFISGYSDGQVRTAIQSVIYAREARIADYTCLGSTSSFYCNLETRGSSAALSAAAPTVGNAMGAAGEAVGNKIDHELDKLGGRGLQEFNGAFSRWAAPWSAATVLASEVCIRNSAGYGLRFKLWDTNTNLVSDFTRDFSAGFTECLQVSRLLGAEPGHPISPRVFVLGYQDGMVQVAQQSVIYDPRAGRADYTCRGSVGGWWCDRESGALLL